VALDFWAASGSRVDEVLTDERKKVDAIGLELPYPPWEPESTTDKRDGKRGTRT
jgi:hypothetical protein